MFVSGRDRRLHGQTPRQCGKSIEQQVPLALSMSGRAIARRAQNRDRPSAFQPERDYRVPLESEKGTRAARSEKSESVADSTFRTRSTPSAGAVPNWPVLESALEGPIGAGLFLKTMRSWHCCWHILPTAGPSRRPHRSGRGLSLCLWQVTPRPEQGTCDSQEVADPVYLPLFTSPPVHNSSVTHSGYAVFWAELGAQRSHTAVASVPSTQNKGIARRIAMLEATFSPRLDPEPGGKTGGGLARHLTSQCRCASGNRRRLTKDYHGDSPHGLCALSPR